jgi:hypothetical protein
MTATTPEKLRQAPYTPLNDEKGMSHRACYVGIDNGVSGSIGIVFTDGRPAEFHRTPIKKCVNYQRGKVRNVNRIDVTAFIEMLLSLGDRHNIASSGMFALMENPMTNAKRLLATLSAIRAWEATLIVIEWMEIPYRNENSSRWQRELLPHGIKGADQLKVASADAGCRLFPGLSDGIREHGDADGLLIAEYARRMRM